MNGNQEKKIIERNHNNGGKEKEIEETNPSTKV